MWGRTHSSALHDSIVLQTYLVVLEFPDTFGQNNSICHPYCYPLQNEQWNVIKCRLSLIIILPMEVPLALDTVQS